MALLRPVLIGFLLSSVVSMTAALAPVPAPAPVSAKAPVLAPAPVSAKAPVPGPAPVSAKAPAPVSRKAPSPAVQPAQPGVIPPPRAVAGLPHQPAPPVPFTEADYLQFAMNLEYLEAEFYLNSVYGYGVEGVSKQLTGGGPDSIGRKVANLSDTVKQVAIFLGYQEIDHIRIYQEYLGSKAVARPLVDVSASFASLLELATGNNATFDPYANDLNWLIAAFVLPYVGLTAYVGTNPFLTSVPAKEFLAGVLGVEAGQDAILRTLLWLRQNETVEIYNLTAGDVTGDVVMARQVLSKSYQIVEENIIVPPAEGPDKKVGINILAANRNSLSFARNAHQTIRILYGNGVASQPGGFFPNGISGTIADYYRTGIFDEGATGTP